MKYIRNFSAHTNYEAEMSKIPTPSVSYCRKENECHFMPNNVIMFKVGDLNGNTNTKIRVVLNSGEIIVPITEGNKWYVVNIPSGDGVGKIYYSGELEEIIMSCKISKKNYYLSMVPENTKAISFISCDISETYLSRFFRDCKKIRTLDLSGWDFSNVTSLEEIVSGCSNLEILTVGNWDTSKVTGVFSMFAGCSKLKSINCTNFRLANIKNLAQVFGGCSTLQFLDLSGWDISNVTQTYNMFSNCQNLQTINLSGWDMTKVTNLTNMFYNCDKLNTIYMRNCNQTTIDKIKAQLETDGILNNVTIITE